MDKQSLKALLIGNFSLKRLIRSMFLIVILIYVSLSLFLYFYAEKIIFQPQKSSYQDTSQIVKIDSGEGGKISAVYLNNPDARYTMLFSHGNAEDIGTSLPVLESIKTASFSIFAYDYRGYGTSTGTASEENSYQDAEAAYNYLVNNLDVPADRIIALGRSLGGAVAVNLAERRQLGGLIIESSFISAYRVPTKIPVFPFDKFKSLSKIKKVKFPVLVIHGTKDEIIPFWHGEKLFQEAGEPKQSLWVEGADHNNLFAGAEAQYNQALVEFVTLIENNKMN